jgi:hypothetical protein
VHKILKETPQKKREIGGCMSRGNDDIKVNVALTEREGADWIQLN